MKDRLVKFGQALAKRKFLIGIITVLLVAGAYFGYQTVKGSDNVPKYTMTSVQKGTLITTVSGTGQVAVSSQIEIKPKVSGQVTSLKVVNGQSVKANQVIAVIDSRLAQRTVRDAQIGLQNAQIALQKLQQAADQYSVAQAKSSLQDAQIALQKLLEPPTAYDLTAAQNAVTQAQRDLAKAKDDSTKLNLDTEQTLQKAYDDGYTAVSNAYLQLPDMMTALNDIQTPKQNQQSFGYSSFIDYYTRTLPANSLFLTTFVFDYQNTLTLYNTNFTAYKATLRNADRTAFYKLISDTLSSAKAISMTLEDGRNLLDALGLDNNVLQNTIDGFKTLMDDNITKVNQLVTSLQAVKDTIDTLNQNSPLDIKNAAAAISAAEENLTTKENALAKLKAGADVNDIASAQEKVKNQQLALDKLMAGADGLDIQAQQLAVKEKQNALNDARAALADYSVTVPFDCLISKVNIVQGDTASSGTSLATVISKQLLADISLNEVDVAKIKIGDKTTLSFDAIDGLSISGEVAEIDMVGTVTQGVVTYNVKIAFDTQDARVKPGMSVSAAIINQVKQDVLMLTSSTIKTQGGVNYVETLPASMTQPASASAGGASSSNTVSTKITPTQVPIEIGIANDTMTEITAGELKEGDQVILKTVTTSSTTPAASGASALRIGGGGLGGALGGGGFGGGGRGGGG